MVEIVVVFSINIQIDNKYTLSLMSLANLC